MDCRICQRVSNYRNGLSPGLIAEFPHSLLVVGDHQFFAGYCLVLLKSHAREIHELPTELQTAHFLEVTRAAAAIAQAYQPWKLNYANFGNQDPHVHWHIVPRYADDPDRLAHPWLNAARFGEAATTLEQMEDVIERVQQALKNL